MLLGLLSAIVLMWELSYVTGFYSKADSVAYLLINGLVMSGLLYLFLFDKVINTNLVRKYSTVLLRLGIVAIVQAMVFLIIYLFCNDSI